MELHEAHLILRCWMNRKVNAYEYTKAALAPYQTFQVTRAAPFYYSLCATCGTVHEAFSAVPLTDGCIECYTSAYEGTAQYWVLHSNLFFLLSKLSAEDCAVLNTALAKLFELNSHVLKEAIL